MTPRQLLATAALAVLVSLAAVAPGARAATAHLKLSYDLDPSTPPAAGTLNDLDVYTPDGASATDSRPVVVYVHGGGWRIGDKSNQIRKKVNLFTAAGYVFVSVNYRLSPTTNDYAPGRIKFPAHPDDVGEAIGWVGAHIGEYGGDPTRLLLIGHSAGAQLVSLISTDPSYVTSHGVRPYQLIGTVSLDTDSFDITKEADPASPSANNPGLFWNAFGTPAENAVSGAWVKASPLTYAGPADPDFLLVTSQNPRRIADNQRMASALGQDPAGVFQAPYDHEGINDAVGSPTDNSGETPAIMAFFARQVAAAVAPARPTFGHRPARVVKTRKKKVRLAFRFHAAAAGTYECRLDKGAFKPCRSPRAYSVGKGSHAFRVRALSVTGRPGPAAIARVRVRHVGRHLRRLVY